MGRDRLTLSLLPGTYAVARLDAGAAWPEWAMGAAGLAVLARSDEELSAICREDAVPDHVPCRRGWRALKVHGPFPFETVGVLATLASALAEARVSVLAVSTYDTDYLLVLGEQLPTALAALAARHTVLSTDAP